MLSNSLILVAGGDPADRETILQALGDEFHVVAAQTIDDAIAHAQDTVSLVVCDLESPRVDGMELVRRWKARRPRTPFIALIDGKDVTAAVEAMKNGVADCVVKPIDQDDLRSAAHQLINQGDTEERGGAEETPAGDSKPRIDIPPGTSLEDLERAAVEQALVQHHGNRTHAAKTLGISVRTLQRKLKAWGMPIVSFSSHMHNSGFVMPTQSSAHHMYSTHAH
jgi:DNA-binding NtrC family response regulator